MKQNISSAMRQIYGTGNYNPRRFDRRPRRNAARIWAWGISLFMFAIVALVLGGMYVFGTTPDSFTGDKVEFELQGNMSPKISSKEDYYLKIKNNESVDLEEVDLFIDWSAKSSSGAVVNFVSSEKEPVGDSKNTWKLGKIKSGQEIVFVFSARFVGPQGSEIEVPFSLSVKPTGFNNFFPVKENKKFTLGEQGIKMSISSQDFFQKDQSGSIDFLISGDAEAFGDLSKLSVKINFPSEFKIESSSPPSDYGQNKWSVAGLPKQEESYKITIKGVLSGEIGKDYEISADLQRDGEENSVSSSKKTISIQSADAVVSILATPGQGKKLQWNEAVDYSITIKNTGSSPMKNVVVSAGGIADSLWQSDSLDVLSGGFFEADKFIWDSSTTSSLSSIDPGKTVKLGFSFKTKVSPPKELPSGPVLILQANVSSDIGGKQVEVKSSESKINILPDINYEVSGWYKNPEGVIVGSGPNPPEAGKETVYQIELKLGPTSSEVKNVIFTLDGAEYVSLKEETSLPVGEIVFNSSSKKIVWSASKIPSLDLPISIKFKIGVSPSSGANSSTILFEDINLRATDPASMEELEFFGGSFSIKNLD